MLQISLLCQLSIRPDPSCVALLPSTPLSAAAAAAAAAAAYCALAKLALFPTVLLSALEQSPFGNAGCHGAGSILPTGTALERGESSV